MRGTKITQERLKELVWYKEDTGDLFYVLNEGVRTYLLDGYQAIYLDKNLYFAHRVIWLYVYGYFPENEIDHINRNRLDNRLCNLREVSRQCNVRNSKVPKTNKTGVKGVSWCKITSSWVSQIYNNKKVIKLGYSKDFTEAVCLRLAAEQCLDWHECDSNSSAYKYVKKILNKA